MHPLTQKLADLSEEELHNKFFEINKKLTAAYRLGYGDAVAQLQMFLEDYRNEISRRSQKAMEDLEKDSPDFKSIIDIN